MKKFLLILCIFVLITQPSFAEEFMAKALNSWIGYSIDNVIASWGYPSGEKQIAGRHLLYWTNNQYQFSANQYGVYGGTVYCNKIFEIDKKKKVISWQYEGNACPNFYFTGRSLVNPQNDEWLKKKQLRRELKAEKHRLKQETKSINKDK